MAKEANTTCDKLDAEIRDLSKKVHHNLDTKYNLDNLDKYILDKFKFYQCGDTTGVVLVRSSIRDLSKKFDKSLFG